MNPREYNNDNYPDLTPCDYFLWGHLKSRVYATLPTNVDDLRIRITAEVNILKENPDLIKKVIRSMRKKAQGCVNKNGGQVERRGLSSKGYFSVLLFQIQIRIKLKTIYIHRRFPHKGS